MCARLTLAIKLIKYAYKYLLSCTCIETHIHEWTQTYSYIKHSLSLTLSYFGTGVHEECREDGGLAGADDRWSLFVEHLRQEAEFLLPSLRHLLTLNCYHLSLLKERKNVPAYLKKQIISGFFKITIVLNLQQNMKYYSLILVITTDTVYQTGIYVTSAKVT